MVVEDIDKLVCATLAGIKAAAEKKELPGQYLLEYEKMLGAWSRRSVSKQDKSGSPDSGNHDASTASGPSAEPARSTKAKKPKASA